ncbi:MAG: tetratricopeptide repeat protein [Alphaproteobacteria bacterium]|nr:tetratricopeptide repeat protein [Alphaproteobacteria bacterium]
MAPAAAPAPSISAALETAAAHHRAGRLAEAEAGYRQVLTVDPSQGDALHLLGVLALQSGDAEEAVRRLEPVVGRYPDVADFRTNLANALQACGRTEEAAQHYRRTLELAPNHAAAHADYAKFLAGQSQWDLAESHYRKSLAINPQQIAVLNNLANLLLQTSRAEECLDTCAQALALKPDYPLALATKGLALQTTGQAEASIAPLRRALELKPDHAAARAGLASALAALSQFEESQIHYQAALARRPDNAKLHADRGWVMRHLGEFEVAVDHLMRALELQPDLPFARKRLLRTLQFWHPSTHLPALDQILLDASAAPDVDPRSLAKPLANQLWCKHVRAPQDALTGADLAAAILSDPLAKPLLARTINCSPAFERVLVTLRRCFLLEGTAALEGQAALAALSLLAQQAHNNSYVWWSEPDEDEAVARLATELAEALAGNVTPSEDLEDRLLRYAMYAPLRELASADALLAVGPDQWSQAMRPVIDVTVREPFEEREIARKIPALTDISDDISRQVQALYEENPYPRWLAVDRRQPTTLHQFLRNELAGFEPPGWMAEPYDLLIAGCGTGLQPIQRALSYPKVRITAVDLSLTSLAYAIRKTRDLGLDRIEYLQGDILQLGKLERRFPVIECGGVLHHMDDPVAAWSILTDLLEAGGVMLIGLYSDTARQHIVDARDRIAALGLKPEPDDIRAFRKRIIKGEDEEDKLLALLTRSTDFYDLHGCRDLIFHSQEHRFTLPAVKLAIADLGLEFLGFLFDDPAAKLLYSREFPDDPTRTNLDNWTAFEQRHPHTFSSMYQFWCRKPAQKDKRARRPASRQCDTATKQ